MAGTLISGPAGAGKSQLVAALRRAATGPTVIADFQSLYAALTGDVRGPDGRFPARDERLLPLVQGLRTQLVRMAGERDYDVLLTNSDGDADRRASYLDALGAGSAERIEDPGLEVVRERLADPVTRELSPACEQALNRWYRRLP